MVVIDRRKVGSRNKTVGVPIKGEKVTPANPDLIDKANAELRKKVARQKANNAEAAVAAKEMIVGSCDDEKGKTLTKKL